MTESVEMLKDKTFSQMVDIWIQEGTLGAGKVLLLTHELVTDPNKDVNLVRNKVAQLATELAQDESNEAPNASVGWCSQKTPQQMKV